jgi:hypothetical protein
VKRAGANHKVVFIDGYQKLWHVLIEVDQLATKQNPCAFNRLANGLNLLYVYGDSRANAN